MHTLEYFFYIHNKMNIFKESLCPYGANDNGTCLDAQYAKATGNQVNFKNDLFNMTEPYEASGNIYLTYNLWDVSTWDSWRYVSGNTSKKDEKKDDKTDDNSLLFMGLGVAGLGAAVIVVMAVRK